MAARRREQRAPVLSLSAASGATKGRRRKTWDHTGHPDRAAPHPGGPGPKPSKPPDVRPAPGSGPGALTGAVTRTREGSAFLMGRGNVSSAFQHPETSSPRGSSTPWPATGHPGLELLPGILSRRTILASLDGLTTVGGLARGAIRKLSAQVCSALEEKPFSYKTQRRNAQAEP